MSLPHTLKAFRFWLMCLVLASCATVSLAQAPPSAAPIASRFDVPLSDEGLPGVGPVSRFEWFRNTWRARRTAWMSQVQQDQQALVFLGDSITHGWGDDLGGNFPGAKVANRGIGGDTSRGVLIRLKEDVLDLHPSGVVLLIGTNDLEQGATPETVASNVRLIIAALHQQNANMPVVLCTVFPSSSAQRRPARGILAINAQLKSMAKDLPHVSVLDTWALFANAGGDADPAEFPDLLHPNAAGYAKWVAALKPLLTQLGLLK